MPRPHARCTIMIRGSFDVKWADYVGEMMLDVQVAEGKIQTTTLLGQPIDLAAFLGAIHMLVDLGFPVMACEFQQAEPIDPGVGTGGDRVQR